MNFANHFWSRERQQFVVALDVLTVFGKTVATKIRFSQFVALDHRSHRAIQNHDAFTQQPRELRAAGVALNGVRQFWIGHVEWL